MTQFRPDKGTIPIYSIDDFRVQLSRHQHETEIKNPIQPVGRYLMTLGDSKAAFLLREYASYIHRLPEVENAQRRDLNPTEIQKKRYVQEINHLKVRIAEVDARLERENPSLWKELKKELHLLNTISRGNLAAPTDLCESVIQKVNAFCGMTGSPSPSMKLTSSILDTSKAQENPALLEAGTRAVIRYMEEYSRRFSRSKTPIKCPMDEKTIIRVCKEENFPLELFLAMTLVESGGGMLGRAVGTKNPLNFGNDDHGNSLSFKSWKDGIRGCIREMKRAGFRGEFSTLEDILERKKLVGYFGDYCPPKGTAYATRELPGLIVTVQKIMATAAKAEARKRAVS